MSAPGPRPIRRAPGARGFTLLEVVVGVSLLAVILGGATAVFQTTEQQVQSARVRNRAAVEHRRNLESIANTLRDAAVTSLGGFDASGSSGSPTFARVLGASSSERTLSETLRLEWRSRNVQVVGVPSPGSVYLVSTGGAELVADRVPEGGFTVRQDGSTLVIQVSTYYATSDRRTEIVAGATAVTLRN